MLLATSKVQLVSIDDWFLIAWLALYSTSKPGSSWHKSFQSVLLCGRLARYGLCPLLEHALTHSLTHSLAVCLRFLLHEPTGLGLLIQCVVSDIVITQHHWVMAIKCTLLLRIAKITNLLDQKSNTELSGRLNSKNVSYFGSPLGQPPLLFSLLSALPYFHPSTTHHTSYNHTHHASSRIHRLVALHYTWYVSIAMSIVCVHNPLRRTRR
jgi:hypothetical protein